MYEQNPIANKSMDHKDGTTVVVNTVVKKSNGLGTAGFVLALLGVLVSWAPVVGWVVWFLGAVLSLVGLFRAPRGLAIAGTVLSFIDVIIILSVAGMIGAMF
ncbi:hypothetical protein [Bifidobacterium jacchi]|uniref:Uncharacterized protein n=1 Tax=Bifidobacterium jacchi TaxID=2490545 RepID=A0A5N5RDD3_9BIFI|nr:hypothetical protein [Bifidobacterium jacchi]KAB5604909.1 hypothetical protein EHS19_09540 [Bifidobacterium jacchi]